MPLEYYKKVLSGNIHVAHRMVEECAQGVLKAKLSNTVHACTQTHTHTDTHTHTLTLCGPLVPLLPPPATTTSAERAACRCRAALERRPSCCAA